MNELTREELLDKVPKIRRKKLELELTELADAMAPHLNALAPLNMSYNKLQERYGRLKVDVTEELFNAIIKEKHPQVYNDWIKTDIK